MKKVTIFMKKVINVIKNATIFLRFSKSKEDFDNVNEDPRFVHNENDNHNEESDNVNEESDKLLFFLEIIM